MLHNTNTKITSSIKAYAIGLFYKLYTKLYIA